MSYRLFVAIELPETLRERLAALRADIPGASWALPLTMHLTLRFFGDDLSDGHLTAVQRALSGIEAAPFALTMQGVGRFPGGPRPPRVLWAGVADSEPLTLLQQQIEDAVETIGFPPEREYQPHITLARLKEPKASPQAQRFLNTHADLTFEPFAVERFVLFSSDLTPRGPIYTEQGVYPLQA